jgi:hypothetical protein
MSAGGMGSHMVEIIKRDIIINPLAILNYIFYFQSLIIIFIKIVNKNITIGDRIRLCVHGFKPLQTPR